MPNRRDQRHRSQLTTSSRTVAVIGGGINGVMAAWHLAQRNFRVTLFERDTLMHATSSASTKLLHGGLRYLENGELRLVRESLRERTWWVKEAPELAHPLQLFLPVYKGVGRPRWVIGAGLTLYDVLAGAQTFGRHRWHDAAELKVRFPSLRMDGLLGAYGFFDAQMDDHALGLWSAARARAAGVSICEHSPVTRFSDDGELWIRDQRQARFDCVLNVAGPWAETLLRASGGKPEYSLDLVRGSHIVLNGTISAGFLVQVPGERRICFILPYKGRILVGTTEVRQTLNDPVICSDAERDYLLSVHNAYMNDERTPSDVVERFAGVRPLIHSSADPSRATREYAFEWHGKTLTVFGGKWTTSRALGARLADEVASRLGDRKKG